MGLELSPGGGIFSVKSSLWADEGRSPSKAFPLGGRWHGEAVTDEGAMIERFRSSQGEFRRLRAASDFARGGKVTKTPPGTRPMDYGSALLRLGP